MSQNHRWHHVAVVRNRHLFELLGAPRLGEPFAGGALVARLVGEQDVLAKADKASGSAEPPHHGTLRLFAEPPPDPVGALSARQALEEPGAGKLSQAWPTRRSKRSFCPARSRGATCGWRRSHRRRAELRATRGAVP